MVTDEELDLPAQGNSVYLERKNKMNVWELHLFVTLQGLSWLKLCALDTKCTLQVFQCLSHVSTFSGKCRIQTTWLEFFQGASHLVELQIIGGWYHLLHNIVINFHHSSVKPVLFCPVENCAFHLA